MAEILIDPSYLSQGNAAAWDIATYPTYGQAPANCEFSSVSGNTATLTGNTVANPDTFLPSLEQYDYFEIRGAAGANNNGLYQVTANTTTSQVYTVLKIAGEPGDLTPGTETTTVFFGSNTTLGNTDPGVSLSTDATHKSVFFNTYDKTIWLMPDGNVTDKGATFQTLYSFAKDQWKDDPWLIKFDFPFTAITPEQFEIGSGTAAGWTFAADATRTTAAHTGTDGRYTRELLRTSGWSEFNQAGDQTAEYAGVITLGTFDAATDNAYYQQGSDYTDDGTGVAGGPRDFVFSDAVNEAVRTFNYATQTNPTNIAFDSSLNTITRGAGDWVAEGYIVGGRIQVIGAEDAGNVGTYDITAVTTTVVTVSSTSGPSSTGIVVTNATDTAATFAADYRTSLNLFLRANTDVATSKAYAASDLAAIGVTTTTNQAYRFPLTNSSDLNIVTGQTITNDPYANTFIRYLPVNFKARIDTTAVLDFGIVIDNNTYTGSNGSFTSGGTVLTTNAGTEDRGPNDPANFLDGGTLYITYSATNGTNSYGGSTSSSFDGTTYDIASATDTTITIQNGTFPANESTVSYIAVPSTRAQANLQQVYTKVQYLLRQGSDIESSSNTVIGKTADEIMYFVGADVFFGDTDANVPFNPIGAGGSGVFLSDFPISDRPLVNTFDNTGGTAITYPSVITLTIDFNSNLTGDQSELAGTQYSKYWMFFEYTNREVDTTRIDLTNVSGATANLVAIGNTTLFQATADNGESDHFQVGDYIKVNNFADDNNNGVYKILARTSDSDLQVFKVDQKTITAETGTIAVSVDEDPIDTPSSIIVAGQPGSGSAVDNGLFTGDVDAASLTGGYAYTENAQGRKAKNTNANILIRSIGLDTGQFVEITGTIENANRSFSVVAGLERNYSNPV